MTLAQGLDQLLLLFRCAENVHAGPHAAGIGKIPDQDPMVAQCLHHVCRGGVTCQLKND